MNTQFRKKIAALILSGLLCTSMALPAFGADFDKIIVNGTEKPLTMPIVETEGSVMISLKSLGEVTGMQISWNDATKIIACVYNNDIYEFKIGSTNVATGSTGKSLSAPVRIIDGSSYIPLNAIVDVFEGQIAISEQGSYDVSMVLNTGSSYGSYTFDQLYEIALKNSVEVAKAKNAFERAELVYDDKNDDYFELPSNNGDPTVETVRLTKLLTMKNSEISLKTAEISALTVRDQIKYQLSDALNDVRVAEGALALAKQDLAVQETIQRQNEIKYAQGLISRYEYEKGQENYKSKALAVEVKASERVSLIAKLDSMLKLGPDQYQFLKHAVIPYDLLENRDLEVHVRDILADSPTIWSLEQVVKLKEYGLTYFVFNAGELYETSEIDLTTAKQNLNLAKQETEVSLRQMYEQIVQLEKSHETLLVEREKLLKDHQVALLNKSVGLVTDLTVNQLKLGIDSVDQQIVSLKANYEALKNAYLQPWAAQ